MAGWGTGSWGTSSWGTGSGAATALSVSYAFASAQNRVTVVLTAEPAHTNAAAPGDALNPATWTLTRLDTGALFTVLSVAEVATTTNGYELTTLEPLGDLSVTHRVTAVSLVDVLGNAAVPPLSADFNGILAQAGGDAPTPADDVVDLRYYHVSRNPIGGTLNIGSDGDYQVMGGVELVRKLIIRRLTTQPGEFFHMPDYGFPYTPKDVVRPVELIKLKASLREAIMREPEVADAGVALTLDPAAGVLTVEVRAQLQAAGETLEINTELPLGAVGF